MIGAAAGIITGFVRDRILIPFTKFVIRWLVRKLGRSSVERAVGEPVWLLAAGVVYTGWALLFGTFALALAGDLLIALGLGIVIIIAGTVYGHFIYKEALLNE